MDSAETPKRLVSRQTLCDHFDISSKTVERWIKEKNFPRPYVLGRNCHRHDLDAWNRAVAEQSARNTSMADAA
jgi:predicted DNA-binding transcriptional regulator AlpA